MDMSNYERKSSNDTVSDGAEVITLTNVMEAIELVLFYHELHMKEDQLGHHKTHLTLIGTVGLSVFLVSFGFIVQTVASSDIKVIIALSLIFVTAILMMVAMILLLKNLKKFGKEAIDLQKLFVSRFGRH